MGVQVVSIEQTDDYPDAQDWHVDGERQLHVRGEGGHLAVYGVNGWISARQTTDDDAAS